MPIRIRLCLTQVCTMLRVIDVISAGVVGVSCARRDLRARGAQPPTGARWDRQRGEKVRKIPRKYMLTCRVSLLLRGLGARVGVPGLSMAYLWRREVARATRHSLPRT